MKIAIASCINSKYRRQPVWGNIASTNPDVLVLLGDNIYLDIPWANPVGKEQTHPSDLSDEEFLAHGHELYKKLLSQSGFKKLVHNPSIRTFSIWDDHDFLWNDAAGGSIQERIHGGKVRASRALQWQFTQALSARDTSVFPSSPSDSRLNKSNETAPGYTFIQLDTDVMLHLTDGRSYRNSKTMLGENQRNQITDKIDEHPQAIHLIASGNVVNADHGDRWDAFQEDYDWLIKTASSHKLLVMSGDVHENRLPDPINIKGNVEFLHEITSSGAAIGSLPTVINGYQLSNFGVINIEPAANSMTLELYQGDSMQASHSPRKINLSTWRAA